MNRLSMLMLTCSAAVLLSGTELNEPLTIASEKGVLNLLMVAKAAPVTTLPGPMPTGWVYEICKLPSLAARECPVGSAQPNYYGGTLLQLQKGDLLKVRLVNKLPPVTDSDHALEPGHEFLKLNPTNIHTHGMLVSPHGPSANDPTYGDNVFVLTFNSANGQAAPSPHMHSDIRYDYTDYSIQVPETHPSGLFWFHPHAHGLALNQVSSGLAGIITVGKVSDYVTGPVSGTNVRHMMLKDMQVLQDGTVLDQEDPNFCAPRAGAGDPARQGFCSGQDNSSDDGGDYTGGRWHFTVNGQSYPTAAVQSSQGEIWRLANLSGSVTYDLQLWNPSQNRAMMFQVLAVDGVSVGAASSTTPAQLAQIAGSKFRPETCPDSSPALPRQPLCTRLLHMMPSSRIEIWVNYRDAKDRIAAPPRDAFAILRTTGYETGPDADSWPAVHLARVSFQGAASARRVVNVNGEALDLQYPSGIASNLAGANAAVATDASCKALPAGHRRRIFFAAPTTDPDAFGLGYEEVDANGRVVGTPATDVARFDPMTPTICVPLGPGNTPVVERWELVNLATEDHNFHIHQTKFRVLSKDEVDGTILPTSIAGKGIMVDNLPLDHGRGTCGNNPPEDPSNPIADWRAGLCRTKVMTVEIPFTIAGDFVYHCHILEHEDGGMMARIRVRPSK